MDYVSGLAMSCAVGRRHGLDLAWLWQRPEATDPVRPLALEPPHAAGAVLKTHTQNSNSPNV